MEKIWGGSPATAKLQTGLETVEINDGLCDTPSLSADSPTSDAEIESQTETSSTGPAVQEKATPQSTDQNADRAKRRALLDESLTNHKKRKLEKKLSVDNQLLCIAKEELEIKKEFIQQQKIFDAEHKQTLHSLATTMEKLSNSIADGFAALRCYLPPPQHGPSFQTSANFQPSQNFQFNSIHSGQSSTPYSSSFQYILNGSNGPEDSF